MIIPDTHITYEILSGLSGGHSHPLGIMGMYGHIPNDRKYNCEITLFFVTSN
jgi:hypothetical protein